ncbi:uncharacterized protein ColSpa_06152 [Colletotrichum spaethianum]|uniref:Uncharacterized protein n=1 Tax=Colletotrichum spaethianum TaxID=700344 RepID=A0AA37LC79_9PEZI|nr:uncharacterized protein ColSpa_06152 [Colletotrichum spaethianum]GKT45971.1 hypothetical protein ColSpa_06152 [Colletotrichum spaethianum]
MDDMTVETADVLEFAPMVKDTVLSLDQVEMDGIGAVSMVEFHVGHGVSTGCVSVAGWLGEIGLDNEELPADELTTREDGMEVLVPVNVWTEVSETVKDSSKVDGDEVDVIREMSEVLFSPAYTELVETVPTSELTEGGLVDIDVGLEFTVADCDEVVPFHNSLDELKGPSVSVTVARVPDSPFEMDIDGSTLKEVVWLTPCEVTVRVKPLDCPGGGGLETGGSSTPGEDRVDPGTDDGESPEMVVPVDSTRVMEVLPVKANEVEWLSVTDTEGETMRVSERLALALAETVELD